MNNLQKNFNYNYIDNIHDTKPPKIILKKNLTSIQPSETINHQLFLSFQKDLDQTMNRIARIESRQNGIERLCRMTADRVGLDSSQMLTFNH